MKTLSVKQVSEVLGLSTRAILKRLDKKQLKGTRRTNKFGVEEWWIYPTGEIKAALERAGQIDILGPGASYLDSEVIDIDLDADLIAPDEDTDPLEDEDSGEANKQGSANPAAWTEARGSAETVADSVWDNIISRFLGELRERDQLIGEMKSELSEKDRQLKLLPDFQREAELRRKETEAKVLEAAALSKQIEAMKALEEQKRAEVERLSKLEVEDVPRLKQQVEDERRQRELVLSEVQERLAALADEKRELEDAKAALETSLTKEIERLKVEKEEQAQAIQIQLDVLSNKLEKLEEPKPTWWQQFFGIKKNAI